MNLRQCIREDIDKCGLQHGQFDDLSTKMADLLVLSKSDKTCAKYFSYFKKWDNFITVKGGSAIPASPVHIALYLTELIDKRTSDNVVSSTVYSIKWAHSLRNLPDPTDNMYIKNLLETAKRTLSKPVNKKDPITTDMLITLCDKYAGNTDLLIIRDLCMILLSFAAFLRFDEISHLHCNDITVHDTHFAIHIRKSKTDQYRHGSEIVVSRGASVACPYMMLLRYLDISKQSVSDTTFLFRPCFRSGKLCKLVYKDKPLSYTRARECLVTRLREVTGELNIGLHSLRSGGATMAANSGVNDRCWKRHGRWKGETSKDGYVADSLERRLDVSKMLAM